MFSVLVHAGDCHPAAADEQPSDPIERLFRELVRIEPGAGRFPRSLVVGEGDRAVTLAPAGPFQIGQHEVPQDLYLLVMGNNPSRWRGTRNAVEMLDYANAARFCAQLTSRARERKLLDGTSEVRLPTEDEWEYACRAGSVTAYCFGDDPASLGEYAWYSVNAAGNDPPVGAKKSNAWGLFDMHGYLWEWCRADDTESLVAVRGGSWTAPAEGCRSSSRRRIAKAAKAPDIGFRVVVAPIPRSQK